MSKLDLEHAYLAYKANNNIDNAYACMEYLWTEYRDYNAVKDMRQYLGTLGADEKALAYAKKSYFLTGKDVFDDFIIGMEWDRQNKFYLPRREKLLPIVQEMQRLSDHDLKILGIAAPPGIGKTGLGNFFMAYMAGRQPEKAMLMGSHSESILKENYSESLRMVGTDEYNFREIFPERSLVRTNAADLKIDLDTPKRFSTYQFAAKDSSLAGKVRAQGLLYLDDLIARDQVALNREQLDKVWRNFSVDYMQRIEGDCVILLIMTRWSVWDVMGRLEMENEGNEQAKFLEFSATNDEMTESNFDYGVYNGQEIGFTIERYKQIRQYLNDDVTWNALYQNKPIEREGLLFPADSLRYYFELPDKEPDTVISVVDTKDRGTDDYVMPVAYVYGDDYYIADFICDSGTPDVTIPKTVDMMIKHKIKMCRFESNQAGGQIARDTEKELKKYNGITSITTKYSTANKETRIISDSGWVKAHCLFKDKDRQTGDYKKAMQLLTNFAHVSKKKKDDVPDAMSMLADFAQSFETNVLTVHRRMF